MIGKYLYIFFVFMAFLWGHSSVHHRIDTLLHDENNFYIKRAGLYIEAEEYAKAKKDLSIASKIPEKYLIAEYYLTKILFLTQEYDKAEKSINYLIQKYPRNLLIASLYHLKIHIYMANHKEDKAIESYEVFLYKYPHLVVLNDYIVLVDILIRKQKYRDALTLLSKGIDTFTKVTLFIEKYVEIYILQKDYEKALESIDFLIQKHKRLPFLYLRKGQLYEKSGEYDLANSFYSKSLKEIEKMTERQQKIPRIKKLKKELLEAILAIIKKI